MHMGASYGTKVSIADVGWFFLFVCFLSHLNFNV